MASSSHEKVESIGVEHHGEGAHSDPSILNPDVSMLILTWVTFFALLAVLYKFAWKPILSALDEREDRIRDSIIKAEEVESAHEDIETSRAKIIKEAENESKDLIDRGRKAANEASKVIQNKAKEEAQILLTNANHELKASQEKAQVQLRQESVDLAVNLASKIIDQELDEKKHQKLIDKLIQDFKPEEYDE